MSLVPDERALVEKMKGRPFVLLGVNGDDDREKANAIAATEGINWRSFWDGCSLEGTCAKWGVRGWPTISVYAEGAFEAQYPNQSGRVQERVGASDEWLSLSERFSLVFQPIGSGVVVPILLLVTRPSVD